MLRKLPFYLLAIIAVFAVKNNVFFWDAIWNWKKQKIEGVQSSRFSGSQISGYQGLSLVLHLLFGSAGLRPFLKTSLFALIFTGLLTGNLRVYPKQIAQGWDATLAHLPYYYDLRDRMLSYIESAGIPYQ